MGGSKKQTIGYKYFLGMHMVLCHGPIDCIYKILVDKKVIWTGLSTGSQETIDASNIFGGDEKEGGISGTLDIEMGKSDQVQNSYLASVLGPIISAHRGVVGVVLRRMYLGTTSYLKAWSFTATRIYKTTDGALQWYPEKAAISRDPENPIVFTPLGSILDGIGEKFPVEVGGLDTWVVFDLVGLGIPTSKIDEGAEHPDDPLDAEDGVRLYFDFEIVHPDFIPGVSGSTTYEFEIEFYTTSVAPGNLIGTGFIGTTTFTGEITGGDDYHFQQTVSDNIPKFCRFVRVRCVPTEEIATFVSGSEDSYFIYGSGEAAPQPNADMNPAHIIRECLTDTNWGMGYPTSDIDDVNFAEVADTLYNESLGISLVWDRSMNIEAFIEEVLRHIDASLFVSRTTGKYTLKLIRRDYVIGDLLVLDKTNITSVSNPNRVAFGELSNSVTVKFWNYQTETDDSVTVSDTALARIQQGGLIDAAVNYPGFTTKRNATLAAQRDLKALSSGYFSCTIIANSQAKDLNLGSPFVLNWPEWGINNMVMRVTGISFGDGINNKIRIIASEDIYATTTNPVIVDNGTSWVDPSQPPSLIQQQIALEVPYYEAVQNYGQTNVDEQISLNPNLGYVMAAAARPTGALNARLWTDAGTGYSEAGIMDFCPFGVLGNNISATETTLNLVTFADLDDIQIGSYAQIGEGNSAELVRIDTVDILTGVITCGRGCLDTTPKKHLLGDRIFFMDVFTAADQTEYTSGEQIGVKLTSITGQGQYDLNLATEMLVDLDSRAYRPYAPGQFQINSEYYTPDPLSGTLTFTWVGRDRRQQTSGEIYDHTFGNIGPESGTTYRIQGYIDGVLVHTNEPVTSGVTWTPTEGIVKVEIHSKRDGVYSFQPVSHEFPYTDFDWLSSEEGEIIRVSEESEEIRLTED